MTERHNTQEELVPMRCRISRSRIRIIRAHCRPVPMPHRVGQSAGDLALVGLAVEHSVA